MSFHHFVEDIFAIVYSFGRQHFVLTNWTPTDHPPPFPIWKLMQQVFVLFIFVFVFDTCFCFGYQKRGVVDNGNIQFLSCLLIVKVAEALFNSFRDTFPYCVCHGWPWNVYFMSCCRWPRASGTQLTWPG